MRRLLVRLRRASERGGRDLQQRFSMLTAISVAIAVLVVGTMTYVVTQRALYREIDEELVTAAGYMVAPSSPT